MQCLDKKSKIQEIEIISSLLNLMIPELCTNYNINQHLVDLSLMVTLIVLFLKVEQ